ncbi:hypothetical protein TWF102_009883 [Orbilia oligospora]|uniref:ATP phosphoribosyltransferase n=1 Tax=Orbilia oligospora TaxID=2813651 RepID=A0A7C8N9I1_ORBOL|nr:hypothetical protein TWF103_011139 [Orbilia oligospora]KAF3109104.1 hypothetical protein TWF102_009883 [Orbilia oligospora]KAF3114009.1 hypothetical protein TWF706_009354 [Orbilia oligospora]
MHIPFIKNIFSSKPRYTHLSRSLNRFLYYYINQRSSFSTTARMSSSSTQKYKLIYFVPVKNLDATKAAIFAAGAGRYPGPGNYTECAWVALGTGQYKPGSGAKPHIGKVGELEKVEEARVETLVIGAELTRKVVAALKSAHPYEEPAYDVIKVEDF